MATSAEDIKASIKQAFKECIKTANLSLLNATEIKDKIEQTLEALRQQINPLIEEYVEKEQLYMRDLESEQDTASICSESSKYFEIRNIDSNFTYQNLLGKKKKLKVAEFVKVEEDENGKLVGLIKMAKSTRIKSFEKRTGATAISASQYRFKLETRDLKCKSELFSALNQTAQALFRLSEEVNQRTNDLFNGNLFKLVISVKEQVFNEFTLQGVVFAVCVLASSISESCEIVGFERSFNTRGKGTANSIEVDGALSIGSTFILFEFKHHGAHHRVDAMECIKSRNYNGKIRLSTKYTNVICIGSNFQGVSFQDKGFKCLETTSVQTGIKNSNIHFQFDNKYYFSRAFIGKFPSKRPKITII